MSNYDRYEDRRQNEKDLERLEAECEARIKRQALEIKLTRRLRDNPDALRVLHGAEDDRLMRDIMGQRVPRGEGWDISQIISFSESQVSFLVGCLAKSDARSSQVSDNLIN